ncbi:hypothetical protein [Desulfofundulus thermocisternus]|uniref:hypothetical protein n=1 Tax=Desulfofundulus thermocisternus TaxID=42471 RepID=UPI000487E4DD|nr:hypothetical protein [Desulfofundulus thermocisternus]
MKLINCRWCGNKFQPRKNSQKYCDECRSDPEVERARARERKRKQLERKKKAGKKNDRQKKEKRCLYCGRKLDPSSNRQLWCEKCRKNGYRDTHALYMRKWRAKSRATGYPTA